MSEHASEPVPGLPERLPADEHIVWQGNPDWRSVARRVFHLRKLALYFAVLIAWRAGFALFGGASPTQAALSIAWFVPLALLALGGLGLLALLIGRTTVYTITNRRVVMRIGIVLSVTFNLPLRTIESAGLRLNADGTGDIPITLISGNKIAYVHLWPHARPWHFARTEPMLRAVPDAASIADILRGVLLASYPEAGRTAVAQVIDARQAGPERRPVAAAA